MYVFRKSEFVTISHLQGLKNTSAWWPVVSATLVLSTSCLAFKVLEVSFGGLWHTENGEPQLMKLKATFFTTAVSGVKLFWTNRTEIKLLLCGKWNRK
jgi:hypothetical protein